MKELKLNVPEEQAQDFAKEMMELMRKYDVTAENIDSLLPITERVKTFDDACKILGDEHPLVTQCRLTASAYKGDPMTEDFIAYFKLRIIVAALNEGWEPQFTEGEVRYYPYYWLYTKEEVDAMDDDRRSRLLYVGGNANTGSVCGLSASHAYSDFSPSTAYIGARLTFKTRDLALYAARQFFDIYADFMFLRHGGQEEKVE